LFIDFLKWNPVGQWPIKAEAGPGAFQNKTGKHIFPTAAMILKHGGLDIQGDMCPEMCTHQNQHLSLKHHLTKIPFMWEDTS
jgi:hypothetical protein